MFNIEEELKKLPNKPGVYIMHDKNNNVIYVGKAVILRNRVKSYFRKNNKTIRIQNMVSLIDNFEYIVTDNEAEALILECNLIKKYRPKFNVLLKDDKTYPYIKIDVKSKYPRVIITRKIINDGARYFGPYANPGYAKEMLDFLKTKFKIIQCKNFPKNNRACLNYHIDKCQAPCIGKISSEEYKRQINQIIMLLEGKTDKILKELDEEMKIASSKMEYEKAAFLRDKKIAIEAISQKQKVSNISENNIDVIGIAKNDLNVCVEVFFIRGSKLINREHYFLSNLKDMDNKEIISGFIKQYYLQNENIPNKIMIKEDIEDRKILEEWLSKKEDRKVEIKYPKKGEKLRLVELAEKNAKVTLDNNTQDKYNIMNELQYVLKMNKLPRKIETFDISNISGTNIVAGMCVMQDGTINKKMSRRFKIKTVFNQDDPKCMEEVITRRIKNSIDNPNGAFGLLPDAIFVDGGITQIKAAKKAIEKYDNINIKVYGMVKDDKHRTRALINENREELKISADLMNLITKFQDTVHDIAIEYHRKLREKESVKSVLDEISGIGEIKKIALLKKFGSVENIRKANIDDLLIVKGINRNLAEKIKKIIY